MTAYLQSVQDLKKDVLKKCGELTDGTSVYETNGTVLSYLNKAYVAVLSAGNEFIPDLSKPWTWALERNPIIVVLQPPYSTGTVAVVKGSTTITFSAAPTDGYGNTVSVKNWVLKVTGYAEYFFITAHTSGATTATIDTSYNQDTAAAASFQVIQLHYDITNVLRVGGPALVSRAQEFTGNLEGKIYLIDEKEMMKDFPLWQLQQAVPTKFAKVHETNDGTVTLRFNRYVSELTRVEIPYIAMPVSLRDIPVTAFAATVTIASPGVWTYASHGLQDGDTVIPTTTGALPTGLTAGTTYYVVSSTTNTFQLAATAGGTAINTSGVQSGTHTITQQNKDYPLVPNTHRDLLVYIAATWLCADKNDNRADLYKNLAITKGISMSSAAEKEKTESSNGDRFGIVPRQDNIQRGRRYVTQETT